MITALPYQAYYENSYRASLGETELLIKPEIARDTIRLIELARQYHTEKRTITL